MAEYVTKEQVIDWYRPYGQTDEPIPFETLVSDLRDMKTADVAPVMHGKWIHKGNSQVWECSRCGRGVNANPEGIDLYCYHCGAKMDEKENDDGC